MKKFLAIIIVALMAFSIAACGGNADNGGNNQSSGGNSSTPNVKSYTVAFEVDGERYKTLKVNDGEKITAEVTDPTKEGHSFTGWALNGQVVTLADYTVTANVTFTAQFTKNDDNSDLNVNDVKVEGKEYYLVVGWWEVIGTDSNGEAKHTSYLNEEQVRLFYANLILYLKAKGATDTDLTNVSVRNYSSEGVASMGEKVLADGDVDLMIGVGNNVNSAAGLQLYEGTNDSKFATTMGTTPTSRYVALLSTTNELGVNVFDWLKTDTGKQAFLKQLAASDITVVPERSNEINVTVIVHGDTTATTNLLDADTAVTMPEITVAEGKVFKGFALSEGGAVALTAAKDATLKYADVKSLFATGETTINLYPVIEDKVEVAELNAYVQVQGSYLYEYEAKLLEARFMSTLTADEQAIVHFHIVDGNATAFTEATGKASDVDVVIGGNNPVNTYTAHANGPLANAGAKHFASTNRKVAILSNTDSYDLAKKLYDFVVAAAVELEVHVAFWTKGGDWVTATEEAAIKASIEATLNTALNIGEGETLADKYNVKITFVDVTTDGNKVADLGAATNALRENKGTDLVVGCGGNVSSTGGVTVVETQDVDTTIIAANRKVAIVTDNYLTRLIYETCFTVPAVA